MKHFAIVVSFAALLALAPGTLAASTLTGKYETSITGDNAFRGTLNGTWTLTFSKRGSYSVIHKGKGEARGKASITGATITLSHEAGPIGCPGAGKYTLKRTGKKLTFTLIHDGRSARAHVLARIFTKVA
jgi:hypothetical protein